MVTTSKALFGNRVRLALGQVSAYKEPLVIIPAKLVPVSHRLSQTMQSDQKLITSAMVTVNHRSRDPHRTLSTQQIRKEKHRRAAITLAASVAIYGARYFDKQPMHMSILTGQGWVHEMMTGKFIN